jgi:hypothetical protein
LAEEKVENMPQREGKRNALFAVNGSAKRFFSPDKLYTQLTSIVPILNLWS